MRICLIGMLSFCVAAQAAAQGISSDGPASTVCFERADFVIQTPSVPDNPYLQEEASLDMLLESPSGRQLSLPCFWVDGTRWAARFTPQEKGIYRYHFVYRQAGQEPLESVSQVLKVKKGRAHGILHTDGFWLLRYDDGTPFRGVGENICWESRESDDSKYFKELHEQHDRFNYEVMLPDFAAAGGNFCRMWMCSWNFPIDRHDHFNNTRYTASDAYYNPSAVQHLDDVLALAEKLNLKIMLCLGSGDVRADERFFTSDEAKARYRNRLRYIVARWGYSPSVGMWEFFNEVDNIMFNRRKTPIPAQDVVAWHTEMADYLKALDPYDHIVTTSISHRDIPGLNDVPGMDLNQKHIYKATSSIPSTLVSYGKAHGKPYVIGEFGYEWDWSKNFDDFAEDMDRDFKRGLWYGLFSPTPVTPMSWWWEYFQDRNLVPYFRNVREVNDRMLSAGRGSFQPVEVKASGADAYAVRCGTRVYVYAYNTGSKPLESLQLSLDGRRWKVSAFDFENNTFGKAVKREAKDGILEIPLSLPPCGEVLFELK